MKHSILKTGITEIVNAVDPNSGEILDTEVRKHTYMANTKEEFFIGYSSLIGAFMEMTQSEIRVFGYLLRYAKGVKFDISKKMRIEMSDVIKLNERTILNTLPILEEKQIIYKYESGLYQLNPRYAFQGSTTDRNNALKTIIELGCLDC